jgi:hypothetical protein
MVPSDHVATSPRRWALSAWASLGLICALSLKLSPTILPSDDLGLAGFRTPEVTRNMQLGQTFEMNADGLHAVEFYPAATDRPVSGMLRLQLVDTTGVGEAIVRTSVVDAADVVRTASYRYEFEPIRNSRNRQYRFDLISDEQSRADASFAEDDAGAHGPPRQSAETAGIAVWATKGERYPGGYLYANGRRRWADMAFRTFAPTFSVWHSLAAARGAGRSQWIVVLASLVATWISLGIALLASFAIWNRSPASAPQPTAAADHAVSG